MTDTATRFKRILVEHVGVDEDQITDDATFEDLGADSLDIIELAMAAEEEFGFEIEDDALVKLKTVGEAVELLESLR